MKQVLSVLVIILMLAREVSNVFYCTTGCTYVYDGSSNYLKGCFSASNSDCKECDTTFYSPTPNPAPTGATGGTCTPLPNTIYNSSFTVAQSNWVRDWGSSAQDLYTVDAAIATDWLQFQTNTHYTQLRNIPSAHYGIRCRILMHLKGPGFQPTVRFRINSTFTQTISLIPVIDSIYGFQEWIYTSSFISYTDPMINLMVERTDTAGISPGQAVAFRDVMCFVAQCVYKCLSCTSLRDCSACDTGYYLNPVTRFCEATNCPAGQFNTVFGNCSLCDPLCDSCTASGATNCLNCTDSGPYQSFLQGTTCYQTCPGIYVPNYLNHKCQCPATGYSKFVNSTGICVACPANCQECDVLGVCTLCKISFFMRNDSTACVSICPSGQYANLIYDIAKCYLCDLTACKECVNSSTMCTSCNWGVPGMYRYLYNFECLYLCPDGYEGNNSTFECDLCPLGMYSFENVCYSQCPTYYLANDNLRACVVPGGYPINMTVYVQSSQSLKFKIPLTLGLSSASQAMLRTSWKSFISLLFITETSNTLLMNQRRALATVFSQTMDITNAVISNGEITLYSNSVSAEMLIYTHTFMVKFRDNLLSPRNVIYSIRTSTSTDDNPWFIQQYFDLNLKPYYLIGLFLAVFSLLVILMRTKHVYRILVEYIHCIQLLGLTLYAIYPHSVHVYLYSFLMGLDFSNFSFLYNVPAKLIPPCYDCVSLMSFSFAIGDMNWLRMMGSLILCLAAMLIFCAVTYIFKCSRTYAPFFLGLVIDLVIIKIIHGWFASLLYSGLNYKYNEADLDMYVLGTHIFSYVFLFPVCYTRIKAQHQNNYLNFSFLFLVIFIILLTLLSLAPTLICALLVLTTCVEWGLIHALNITQEQKPQITSQKITQVKQIKEEIQEEKPFILSYHNHLLRCIKPLTALLVACIIMIEDQTIPIALVSAVLGMLLILIMIDAYFLYDHEDKSAKIETKIPQKSNENVNETKEDLKQQKQTEYRDNYAGNNPKDIKIFEQDDMDDDVVANKFRKVKNNNQSNGTQVSNRNVEFFKNLD